MLDTGMTTVCDVLLLPERGAARSVETLRAGITLFDAVRYAIEQVAADAHARTVIRTPKRNIFPQEVASLHAVWHRRRNAQPPGPGADPMPFAA